MSHSTRVSAGHKAALHNPNVSDETKQHEREYLENEGVDETSTSHGSSHRSGNKDPKNVERGYKATTHNPNVSEDAKQHAKDELEHNEKFHNYQH
ncbi:Conidiation protein 6 [Schizosaccharomyces osmophilus]|uniref:Conidiation protein 6 n=1 Tax=Schizosaccharomyces osmophilus TaxID=2545709 RepID=A0AAE9WBU8_9SCHI|nr:Conidiation protein 6 [Schizosaccharomyces osmophilus]WBW73492.1 Conidiation protein 6 [Schizosaccharomyces osmophilus]